MVAKKEADNSFDSVIKLCCAEEECEPEELSEVVLDEENLPKITKADMSGDIAKCENLTLINLTCCGLTSIDAPFPELPNVQTVDMSENKLTSDVLDKFSNLSALRLLVLRGNLIETVDEFKALRDLKALQAIDIEGCPVTKVANYREKIFKMLEQVEVIDDRGREGEKVDMARLLGLTNEDGELVSEGSEESDGDDGDVLDALGREELRKMLDLEDDDDEEEEEDSDPDENDKSEDEEDVDPDIPPVAKNDENSEDAEQEEESSQPPATKKARKGGVK
ncbi:hypothetical protein FOL47_006657 [Perkinsus chesapeaki]|uniref:Acidic leucine-rich nuclear phosphoprotein 32 member n=1 Tax=Perkinsus chesapeaki TaxID=330153 RepID=A0A7J6LQA2_PERCH|nr:hypothetical protein FOL47_006657 [Perkinsus chesapeaki]